MIFDDPDQLIDVILRCIERQVRGNNETTWNRREAMVRFLYRWAWLSDQERPAIEGMLDVLENVTKLFLAALDALGPAFDPGEPLHAELALGVHRLVGVMRQLASSAEDELSDREVVLLMEALQATFDWKPPDRLHAYVYACTGEKLKEGLLEKERSELLNHVRSCALELLK